MSDVQEMITATEPETAPSADISQNISAMPHEGGRWKHMRTATIGAVAVAAAVGIYKLTQSGGHGAHHDEAVASVPDSHAAEKQAPMHDITKRLQLEQYKNKAEEALVLITFYERRGAMEELRDCLATLERWMQAEVEMHGEPSFKQVNGLVTSLPQDETEKQGFWEQVQSTLERLRRAVHTPDINDTVMWETNEEEPEASAPSLDR